MTREEAIIKLSGSNNPTTNIVINGIYDDFKSRTCENCKLGVETNLGFIECGLEIFNCTDEFFDKDFGCKKFQRKEDE